MKGCGNMLYEENESVELKEILIDKVKHEISAFINTNGGIIYVGVKDDGTVVGIPQSDKDKVDSTLSSWIRDVYYPNPNQFIRFHFNSDNVLVIEVLKGVHKPYYMIGKGPVPAGVYIRIGRSTRQATQDEILQMMVQSSGYSYESDISKVQDLHFSTFVLHCEKGNLDFNTDKYQALNFLTSDKRFTNLALLMSDENPIEVKLAVYKGLTSNEFRVKKEFKGSLVSIATQLLEYASLFNDTSAKIVDYQPQRIEVKSFPGVSLREAVINALCHADYSRPSNIKVEFYDDRVEISSPGGIFGGVTLEDILQGKQTFRNPGLINIFGKLDLIENYGTGLRRIMDAYPGFNETALFGVSNTFFTVKLPNMNFHERETKGVNGVNDGVNGVNDGAKDFESIILEIIKEHPGLRVPGILEIAKKKHQELTINIVENRVSDLKKKSLIIFEGVPKTGGYFVIKK